jgi:hypothetical protein
VIPVGWLVNGLRVTAEEGVTEPVA